MTYKHVYTYAMSPKELTAFRIESEIMDGLRRVKDRDGIPLSVQVDRALRAWLERKDVHAEEALNRERTSSEASEERMKVAIYARVSTHEQTAENQLLELRRYVSTRAAGRAVEYVDEGVSGAKDRRPALDQLVADVRRHQACKRSCAGDSIVSAAICGTW